ncbi:hypothetical protein FE634_05210 [Nocardioides dongxiaopingii]|uniref:hypothetical protein n=1 Tax=Nocardioides sp. S-1144 TaxID=2582905 RepID=UPI001165ABCA|nr:hypothetical protein [Nocardioides sp. S-1144]QDH10734.1 hypothetical protein FE634_05210 [Nocardioides sp. S-1144]
MTAPSHVPLFYVKQKFAMTTNRYELVGAGAGGAEGQSLGVAQQKRMAFKEEVTFYTDESRSQAVFSFRARKKIDLNAGYDVFDAQGQQLGFFRKDFGKSLLRSTFHLEGPGYQAVGQERSQAVALVRRFADIPFLPIHFDFTTPDGRTVLSVQRQSTVRDRYTVTVGDPALDFRVAAAVAVGLDALMQR